MKSRIALALLAGIALVGCSSTNEETAPDSTPTPVETTAPTDDHGDGKEDGHEDGHDHSAMAGGLGTSATVDGFTLNISTIEATATGAQELGFVISAEDGTPVTSFEEHHEKTMHMIIFKHDLTDYQHVHPEMNAAGTWTVPVSFSTAGVYHVVADFVSAGKPVVLGTDVQIAGGAMVMASFSEESRTAVSGPYTATLVGDTAHEASSVLKVEFTKDGAPVEAVNPYLGANAHMVAINPATLGYTHMHPNDGFPGGVMTFTTPAMEHGFFKVFLQADFDGELRLFEFVFEGK
jgi:hypothetical protein